MTDQTANQESNVLSFDDIMDNIIDIGNDIDSGKIADLPPGLKDLLSKRLLPLMAQQLQAISEEIDIAASSSGVLSLETLAALVNILKSYAIQGDMRALAVGASVVSEHDMRPLEEVMGQWKKEIQEIIAEIQHQQQFSNQQQFVPVPPPVVATNSPGVTPNQPGRSNLHPQPGRPAAPTPLTVQAPGSTMLPTQNTNPSSGNPFAQAPLPESSQPQNTHPHLRQQQPVAPSVMQPGMQGATPGKAAIPTHEQVATNLQFQQIIKDALQNPQPNQSVNPNQPALVQPGRSKHPQPGSNIPSPSSPGAQQPAAQPGQAAPPAQPGVTPEQIAKANAENAVLIQQQNAQAEQARVQAKADLEAHLAQQQANAQAQQPPQSGETPNQ